MSPRPFAPAPSAVSDVHVRDGWWFAGLAFCVLMLGVHVVAGMNSAGVADSWRDMYWASVIAHGERFPLAGPPIHQMLELGPWWFYLLAVPMGLTGSVALTSAFVQTLAAFKYVLAWRLGLRIADARFAFAFAVSLAIAGWSIVPLLFPTHTALVETALLLLAWVAWRCMDEFSPRQALWFGLASAACLHAHPTTLGYVIVLGLLVLWRHRSLASIGWMALAAGVVVLALLPPWLDRGDLAAGALKTMPAWLDGDVAVSPLTRFPALVRSLVVGGAWWGLLLMVPWQAAVARLAWWTLCASLVLVAFGLVRLRRDDRRMFRIALGAGTLFLVEVAFVVLVRPITTMWMVPACLPPLALLIAAGWYGWLRAPRPAVRVAAIAALVVYVALSLAPFSIHLRDLRSVRVMQDVNPFMDVIEHSDRYVDVAVPFYPARRIDRLAKALCAPAVLHGRLAGVIEASFATPLRNACGHWPQLRYGGVEGSGVHVAGLLPHMATASGIPPTRVVARMALYEPVRAIAPAAGAVAAPMRRLQVDMDSGSGPATTAVLEFETDGGDAVVLTNRMPNAAPMRVERIEAAGQPAALRGEDGSSFVYRCDACAPDKAARWRIELNGIQANLDVVVLPGARGA